MSRGRCAIGFYEFQSRCYYFEFSTTQTFANAESACRARQGSQLVVANSDQVMDFILHYLYQVKNLKMWNALSRGTFKPLVVRKKFLSATMALKASPIGLCPAPWLWRHHQCRTNNWIFKEENYFSLLEVHSQTGLLLLWNNYWCEKVQSRSWYIIAMKMSWINWHSAHSCVYIRRFFLFVFRMFHAF